jgi:hypothetical protein
MEELAPGGALTLNVRSDVQATWVLNLRVRRKAFEEMNERGAFHVDLFSLLAIVCSETGQFGTVRALEGSFRIEEVLEARPRSVLAASSLPFPRGRRQSKSCAVYVLFPCGFRRSDAVGNGMEGKGI